MKFWTIFTTCALAVCLFGGRLELGIPHLSGIFKMVASFGFIALAIRAGAKQSPYGKWVLAGLFFSWWGDLFLIYSAQSIFLMGLVSFLLGHVCYAIAFSVHGIRPAYSLAAAVALLPVVYVVFQWLNPHLGDMRIPVYAYMTVITAMVILSAGAWGKNGTWLMLAAAVLFWVSDIMVAKSRFVSPAWWNGLIGLPLYYGGQVVFGWSVYAMLRKRTAQTQAAEINPSETPA
ncbi:MAG: lysoplasmalogenase [Candidatus Hydrogenedentes bacterium]|nr:lysoplasmalogenase [Candidatus Hydrogenedentota bacterium]